jgi:hypothetical protein
MPQENYGSHNYGTSKELENYTIPQQAWDDDSRVEFHQKYGGFDVESQMSYEEETVTVVQNNTAILVFAGAVILAYALTR